MGVQAERTAYRLCRGRLFVNDEPVPLDRRVLNVGLAAAGLAPDSCGFLSERDMDRILHLERTYPLARLAEALRAEPPGRAA